MRLGAACAVDSHVVMAGGSVDGASRLRIRHKPAIPHHQQIVGSRADREVNQSLTIVEE